MNKKAKKTFKILTIGGGLLLTAVLIAKSNASDKLQYIVKIHKISIKDLRIEIQLLFEIANPTKQNLKVNSISGDIYFKETNLGMFRELNGFEIQPLMVTKVIMTVIPNLANVIKTTPLIIATKSPVLVAKYTINSIVTVNDQTELPISL